MKTGTISAPRFATRNLAALAALGLLLAACAQTPKPVTVVAAPPPPLAVIEPLPLPLPLKPDPSLVNGRQAILQVQKALVALGYKIPRPDGRIDKATLKALAAFEKDRGLAEDPKLTLVLAEKIKAAADEARVITIAVRPGDFLVYSDGEEEVASAERAAVWEQDAPRALVAVRPAMGGWPAAARAGLDWALTHALDTPATAVPLKWSSTGVEEQFEIRTYPTLTPREASLVGGDPASCRRFELRDETSRYPGIACRDADGTWYIPHSTVRLARPASGLGVKAAAKKKS
jgi:peptidoglycan hydrolase-like protein with peptidoglycan-binding domain